MVRPPSSYTGRLKRQQMAAEGLTAPDAAAVCPVDSGNRKCYEEDHLIPLEVGGHPTDPKNLWPEPYNTTVNGERVGAHEKDVVEDFLHDAVCLAVPRSRRNSKRFRPRTPVPLARAQEIIATDWYACYVSIVKGEDCR